MSGDIIVIEKELLKSKVYRSLNGTAKNIYSDFLMKCQIKMIKAKGRRKQRIILNNGKIEYCYSEAEQKGTPRATFMRAIDELIGKGFIDCPHSGSGTRKGDKSLYGISERWRTWGTDKFIEKSRRKDGRQGRGFAILWKKRKLQS
jgi:hypothetical protein